ncbi:MAG: hypothetical protein GF383_08175 [Candidatus Lokiarchaeota archaeon]|nr:hypothetical protein [Candidatus Lokiarchaeota archaeon]MBD3340319.1 hypothetical protein [Candidatus Lokiarchaeota archaeon]
MMNEDFIFTISGIRGIPGKNLSYETIKKIGLAYGIWLDGKEVMIGRDTRPSSVKVQSNIVSGLIEAGCDIIDLEICPTPIVIYTKNKESIPGGIIVTGSHNPPEWNGIKLLSDYTFMNKEEINDMQQILEKIHLEARDINKAVSFDQQYKNKEAISSYVNDLLSIIKFDGIKNKNHICIGYDSGAGAGKFVVPDLLKKLGCQISLINNDFDETGRFPRIIEPIQANLTDLMNEIKDNNLDIGFAQDCDADRLAMIGDGGEYYSEDVSLALILQYYAQEMAKTNREIIFVTNLASSLMFDTIISKYNGKILRTPVGEYYLAKSMFDLMKGGHDKNSNSFVFGGEGSCGGVIVPHFNNTRDGIFAAVKIIEILLERQERISTLVAKLPKFSAVREYIPIGNANVKLVIKDLKDELINEGYDVQQIDFDLRFGQDNDWFVLVHPSNTEPIFRIISEAKEKSNAQKNLQLTSDLLKLQLNAKS